MDLSIGDLSRRVAVKVPTIRYYEQIGLLPSPPRTEGRQRRYGAEDVSRLSFIRHAPFHGSTDCIDLASFSKEGIGLI